MTARAIILRVCSLALTLFALAGIGIRIVHAQQEDKVPLVFEIVPQGAPGKSVSFYVSAYGLPKDTHQVTIQCVSGPVKVTTASDSLTFHTVGDGGILMPIKSVPFDIGTLTVTVKPGATVFHDAEGHSVSICEARLSKT